MKSIVKSCAWKPQILYRQTFCVFSAMMETFHWSGLETRISENGTVNFGPTGQSGQPTTVVHLFSKGSPRTKPFYLMSDQNFQKVWHNGKHPWHIHGYMSFLNFTCKTCESNIFIIGIFFPFLMETENLFHRRNCGRVWPCYKGNAFTVISSSTHPSSLGNCLAMSIFWKQTG